MLVASQPSDCPEAIASAVARKVAVRATSAAVAALGPVAVPSLNAIITAVTTVFAPTAAPDSVLHLFNHGRWACGTCGSCDSCCSCYGCAILCPTDGSSKRSAKHQADEKHGRETLVHDYEVRSDGLDVQT